MTFAFDLPNCQDVGAALHGVVAFLKSRDFAVNFVANLGGAMIGVLLAFWIERFRARREAKMLYGRVLRTSRSELGYLEPMYKSIREALTAGKPASAPDTGAPATRALLINPLVHDHAPHSLIMALTVMCHFFNATEDAFETLRRMKPEDGAAFRKILATQLDKAIRLITLVLEQIDSQLNRLGLEKTPDAATQEISRRIHEILRTPLVERKAAVPPNER
jgi:hypothetical protein